MVYVTENGTAVTKLGNPIDSCESVCVDYSPEFFSAIGLSASSESGICSFNAKCVPSSIYAAHFLWTLLVLSAVCFDHSLACNGCDILLGTDVQVS